MNKCLAAYTSTGAFPSYINISLDGAEVVVTVRGSATRVNGSRVCGVTCSPKDEHCNNYCNLAPEKGPMQPSPKSHAFEREGVTTEMRMPAAQLGLLLAQIGASFK